MSTELASVLDDCLERLARGETPRACLARYPEQATELGRLLPAAARLAEQARLRPSPVFKARARAQLTAYMAMRPRRSRNSPPRLSQAARLAFGLAGLLLAFAVTGTALAQSALPGEALYAWKLTSEHMWYSISPDPVGVSLILAGRRVDEAIAVSDDSPAQSIALHGYQKVVTDLAQNQDSPSQERIRDGLKAQQEKLEDAGLQPPVAGDRDPASTPVPSNKTILETQVADPDGGNLPVADPDRQDPPFSIPTPLIEIPGVHGPLK